jgi:hypothetical protein
MPESLFTRELALVDKLNLIKSCELTTGFGISLAESLQVGYKTLHNKYCSKV